MRTWLCVSECDETLGYLLAVTLDLLSPTLVAGTGHPPPFWRRSAQAIARAHAIVLWRVDADRPRHIYHCQFPPRQGRLTAIVVLHCATEAPSKLAITAQGVGAPLSLSARSTAARLAVLACSFAEAGESEYCVSSQGGG
jgi:hypothetical protein